MQVTQIHPHPLFVPENATVLILGTFPGKDNIYLEGRDEWFYSAKRNQFWSILREIYKVPLLTTKEKRALFLQKGIAIGDIYLKIKRKENSNSDTALEVVEYNDKAIAEVLREKTFREILATSQLVKAEFKKLFPDMVITALPSPSPRYARMSLADKIIVYKKYLPV